MLDGNSILIYVEHNKAKECRSEWVQIQRQTLQRVLELCEEALKYLKANDNSENSLSEEDSEVKADSSCDAFASHLCIQVHDGYSLKMVCEFM